MALTIEATIVLPLTAAITLGIISSGITISRNACTDIHHEYLSLLGSADNSEMFEAKIVAEPEADIWSKSISVNPVRIKQTIGLMMDTYGYLEDFFPFISRLGGGHEADED
ncbi:MAG: hypothetical protein ACYC5K_11425 [Saccharofermentanales bacterium]